MAILLDEGTRAVVQGITGRIGSVQTSWMLQYNTKIVAGVTPGNGGQEVHGILVYDDMQEAVVKHGANASVVFVPAQFALAAVLEALDAGIRLVVVVPEHIPVRDAMMIRSRASELGAIALGPNTPGIISPGIGKLGIMPANMFTPGRVGIVSRSGTLSYEVAGHLNMWGFGQSTMVGIGGDPVIGTNLKTVLALFEDDPGTDAVVIIGEIGGSAEEDAAEQIAGMSKPVVAYIAGSTAPKGKKMGHAGAIVMGQRGTVESKKAALSSAGAQIAQTPSQVPLILKEMLGSGQGDQRQA